MFKLSQKEFNCLKISKTSQNVTSFGGAQYAPFVGSSGIHPVRQPIIKLIPFCQQATGLTNL